ncbi:hypothetical protein FE257_009261 [Aspergillus nanangensis]|uniref:Cytochrome P450 n=1 Tax=Aspergillus nanangensis TaxID=2582783 RepID=A0AAD4CKD3_ASPNN|nr:hypothetical protein FE257_009261 [Aspergillus nanangensis]
MHTSEKSGDYMSGIETGDGLDEIEHVEPLKRQPLPPKPPGVFLLGNAFDLIQEAKTNTVHLLMGRLAQKHGEIFRFQIGPVTEYFLNSDKAVKEILDRSSAQTAERPRWIVSNEQICNRLNVLLLDASDPRWKQQRRAIHGGLTSIPKADAGLPFLHFESAKFLYEVSNNPDLGQSSISVFKGIARYTYSSFASQTFGMEIPDQDNPVIDYIHETGLAQILSTFPGSHIVDVLTWLDRLPICLKPWERNARARFKRDLEWSVEKLKRIKNDIATGGNKFPENAFLPAVIRDKKNCGFATEEEAAYLSLQLIIGAADTSQISTWSFLEAMMLFPDVQEKARREIGMVVHDRMPEYSDLERIPYVRCLMKETWRWRPPVALGHPHCTTRELNYNGYRIPKGARLHINAWAIGHDPERHEDPDRFWPERYADDPSTTMQSINAKDVSQRDHFAFGSGRRVCPGYHVAERSLAISIMRLLWAFDIKPSPGASRPLTPHSYWGNPPGNASVRMPVALTIRSEIERRIISREFEILNSNRVPLEHLA